MALYHQHRPLADRLSTSYNPQTTSASAHSLPVITHIVLEHHPLLTGSTNDPHPLSHKPTKTGVDAYTASVAGMLVQLPHKDGRGEANEYLGWVNIEIADPMPAGSASGREYVYVVPDD